MLKQNISWTGHDDRPMNRTLYFNLTRYEVAHDMELEVLEKRFKDFRDNVSSDENRPMTPPEIRELLDMVKVLIKHSYGVQVQGPEGLEFQKSEEIWNRFVALGAFDAFIFYLFEQPERANRFMEGIWPKELREAADKVRTERPDVRLVDDNAHFGTDVPVAPNDDHVPSIDGPAQLQSVPDPIQKKQWFEYDRQELIDMDGNEFETLYTESSQGKNVPPMLLTVRHARKQKELGEDTSE